MAVTDLTSPSGAADNRRWRWIGAGLGLLTGLFDAVLLSSGMGVDFRINGSSATLLIGVYFGASFAYVSFETVN